MCGRFSVNKQQVEDWMLDSFGMEFSCQDTNDLRPTQVVSTIHLSSAEPSVSYNHSENKDPETKKLTQLNATWGIKPQWAKKLLINAQGETCATKKTFQQAYKFNRCLVPFSAWFEWKNLPSASQKSKKQKYSFNSKSEQPLMMAGIWFETDDIPQLVTLTTAANSRCADIHKRMPVIITPNNVDYWFNSDVKDLQPLIEPIASDLLSVNVC